MEDDLYRIKTFLKEFNEKIQSPTSDDVIHTRIVNYSLDPDEVFGQVVDWILNYLDNRKCPYSLAVSIAKEVASQISASLSQVNTAEGDLERSSNSANIYSDAISKLPEVCNLFLERDNLDALCSSKYTTSVFAIKNKRRKMEDRYVILHDLNALLDLKDVPFQSYYAIFDGHSGIDAAAYASAQLHLNIAKHPDFFTDTSKAIIEGFQITDQKFLNKCNKENIKSGCTAVVALIRENTIYLSWLGDSQAVLIKEGAPVTLTDPHKPGREDERKRIESLGGLVSSHTGTCRVNGLLAVSRAIGDPDQKEFITSEPDVTILSLDGTEDFLILACDGLWDEMSPEDVSAVLYRYLKDSSPDEPSDAVAAKLVHQSKLQGSEDNITTIVIFLREIKDIIENSSKFMTNPFSVQSHDFLCMNGNTKPFNMETSSEVHVAKPTLLELNSASCKKLKNTANVLSSAGLESSSYSYQYVENPLQDTFPNLDNLIANSSKNALLAHQNITASCFAPETTALSELPTPPIDDMLASQQCENFYSTNLYKEISAAHSVDVKTQQIDANPDESMQSHSEFPFSQHIGEIDVNLDNMNLLDKSSELITVNTSDGISPNEAVVVASTVVSNAVETAVKCLSAETEVVVQSQLNPYAKPFVMKSFIEEPGSESSECEKTSVALSSTIESAPSECTPVIGSIICDQNLTSFSANITTKVSEEICNAALSSEISEHVNNKTISGNISGEQLMQNVNNDLMPSVTDSSILKDVVPISEKEVLEISQPEINIYSESISNEQLMQNVSNDMIFSATDSSSLKDAVPVSEEVLKISQPEINIHLGNISDEQIMQNVNTDLMPAAVDSNILQDTIPISEKEVFEIPQPAINVHSEDKIENIDLSHEDILIPVKAPENKNLLSEQNSEEKSFTASELPSPSEKNVSIELDSTSAQNVFELGKDQESLIKTINNSTESSVLSTSENNQNSNFETLSVSTSVDKFVEKSEESKSECVIASVEKEASSVPESSLLESISKDSLSLVNIQNELNVVGTEVPSDHVIEDSRVETFAVDLKSLPEGIPEAEGVTEDVDSDSEKDGGWSYMKGNTISGSKLKPDGKISKSQKTVETKSSTTLKTKKDLSKPNVDLKNTKLKGSTVDKNKSVADKTKSTVDKSRNVTVADKTKTIASADKNKKSTLEPKKTDVKDKNRILKSVASTTVTKTMFDKTRMTSVTHTKKEGSEMIKTTTISKSTRPTALARTGAFASKTTNISPADKNASDKVNIKPVTSISTKLNTGLSEKSNVRNAASTQSKTLSKSVVPPPLRAAATRPSSTVSSRTTTITKSMMLQKSAVTDSKPKPPVSTMRKPLSAATKKPDVKEVKDNVNKQISAKKNITLGKVVPSTSLASNKRIIPVTSKPTANKLPSSTSKQELSKKAVPKHSAYQSITKNAGAKPPENINKGKGKPAASIPSKTEQTKNTRNMESDQNIVSDAVQTAEEKFILESIDKEVIEKEKCEMPNENSKILENGTLSNSTTPVEDKALPTAECAPENL